jgi:hypothetical protein
MTRSLGDLQEKHTAYIWADPDVAILELEPDLDLTVIACTVSLQARREAPSQHERC